MEKQFEEQDRIDEKLEEIYYSQTQKLTTLTKSKKTTKYVVGDMSLTELDFNPGGDDAASPVRRIKSLNPSNLGAPSNSSPRSFGYESAAPNDQSKNLLSPSYSWNFANSPNGNNNTNNANTIYDFKNQIRIPSKFKEAAMEKEIKLPTRNESGARLLAPLSTMKDHEGEEDKQEKSGITIYLNEVDTKNHEFMEDRFFIQQEDVLSRDGKSQEVKSPNTFRDPLSPEIKEILPTIQESIKNFESNSDETSFKDKANNRNPRNFQGLESWPKYKPEVRAKSFDSKKKTVLSTQRNNNSSQIISQDGLLFSTRKRFLSKIPTITIGDEYPVMAESEKSATLDDLSEPEEENKEGESPRQEKEELIELDQIIDFKESIKSKLHLSKRSKKRSDTHSLSKKLPNMSSGPIVNQLFITERERGDAKGIDPVIEILEREFYCKKILVCTHVSIEKNQLEYVRTKTTPDKDNRFKQELKLLKLQDDSDDSDDIKVEPSKTDLEGPISTTKAKYLEDLRKKMQKKSTFTYLFCFF